MTLSKEEKSNLIEYRLNQAKDSEETAAFLVEKGKLPTAVNRIYYAIFYCSPASALQYEFATSKHLQLLGWFNKNFLSSGLIEPEYGEIARKCYEYRRAADYDAYVTLEEENIKALLFKMNQFLDRINVLLKN